MSEERIASSIRELVDALELILALPPEARRRIVDVFGNYLRKVDAQGYRMLDVMGLNTLAETRRRGAALQIQDMEDALALGDRVWGARFEPGIIDDIVAVYAALISKPREEQRFLVTLAAFVNSHGTSEDHAGARCLLDFWARARSFP